MSQDNVVISSLLNNTEFMGILFNAMNTLFTIDGTEQPLKDFNKQRTYEFLHQSRISLSELNKDIELRKEAARLRAEEMKRNGASDEECANHVAGSLNLLDIDVKNVMHEGQLKFSDEVYAALMSLVAKETGEALIIEQDNAHNNLRVKFTDVGYTKLTDSDKKTIANRLGKDFGEIDSNETVLMTYNGKRFVYVEFKTFEAKEKCLQAGVIPWLGTATNPPTAHLATEEYARSLFLNGIKEDTIEEDVCLPFRNVGVEPDGVVLFGDKGHAYAGYNNDDCFFNALRLREVKIKGRTVPIVAAKSSDPDELKAIIGFFVGKTIKPKEMYAAVDAHGWNLLYLQPVFWDNGALKHYYFAKFRTVKDKEEAMWNPLNLNGEILQAYEISRDKAGRLVMPAEGEWRKRAKRAHNPPPANTQQATNRALAPLTLRKFAR